VSRAVGRHGLAYRATKHEVLGPDAVGGDGTEAFGDADLPVIQNPFADASRLEPLQNPSQGEHAGPREPIEGPDE